MQSVNRISLFKAITTLPSDDLIYVKKCFANISGGGGIFLYSSASIKDNEGIYLNNFPRVKNAIDYAHKKCH